MVRVGSHSHSDLGKTIKNYQMMIRWVCTDFFEVEDIPGQTAFWQLNCSIFSNMSDKY